MQQAFPETVERLLRARAPLIAIETREEERAIGIVSEVCKQQGWLCVEQDGVEGFHTLAGEQTLSAARDLLSALTAIERADETTVAAYVLKDLPDGLNNPMIKRTLLNTVQRLKFT